MSADVCLYGSMLLFGYMCSQILMLSLVYLCTEAEQQWSVSEEARIRKHC